MVPTTKPNGITEYNKKGDYIISTTGIKSTLASPVITPVITTQLVKQHFSGSTSLDTKSFDATKWIFKTSAILTTTGKNHEVFYSLLIF